MRVLLICLLSASCAITDTLTIHTASDLSFVDYNFQNDEMLPFECVCVRERERESRLSGKTQIKKGVMLYVFGYFNIIKKYKLVILFRSNNLVIGVEFTVSDITIPSEV